MNLAQRPIPGYWYGSPAGQLLNVRAFLYYEGRLSRIWIEDIEGTRQSVTPAAWKDLDLILHSPVVKENS